MAASLGACSGAQVRVTGIGLRHWGRSVSARGWRAILDELDAQVRQVMADTGQEKVTLVGHSSGGVMARLYLAPEAFHGRVFGGRERVNRLVTLGSPHTNQRIGPVRRWVDEHYPGAYFAPAVTYTCVAGRLIQGDRHGGWRERLAFRLYESLSGSGREWGDGLVPLPCALLPGSEQVVLDGVGHAPVRGGPWYGSANVVRRWWPALATAPPTSTSS